jgi:hypothetical protein
MGHLASQAQVLDMHQRHQAADLSIKNIWLSAILGAPPAGGSPGLPDTNSEHTAETSGGRSLR